MHVPECQTILDYAAAGDDGCDSGNNQTLKNMCKSYAPSSRQIITITTSTTNHYFHLNSQVPTLAYCCLHTMLLCNLADTSILSPVHFTTPLLYLHLATARACNSVQDTPSHINFCQELKTFLFKSSFSD